MESVPSNKTKDNKIKAKEAPYIGPVRALNP